MITKIVLTVFRRLGMIVAQSIIDFIVAWVATKVANITIKTIFSVLRNTRVQAAIAAA